MNGRGRGPRWIPASLVFHIVLVLGCGGESGPSRDTAGRAAGAAPSVASATAWDSVSEDCRTLPDTIAEPRTAVLDRSDLPFGRLDVAPPCPVRSVGYLGLARIERSYRVRVPAGRTLVARARGEVADLTLAIDLPATPDSSRANVARLVTDSIRVDETRDVIVRVLLVPRLKPDVRESRVLLSVLVR